MKIAIIGSSQYIDNMFAYSRFLRPKGYEVKLPSFDKDYYDEFEIAKKNREIIEWADEVHIFWDNRSPGTILDFGMCFALRKKIKIVYLEQKTIAGIMKKYEKECYKS